MFVIYNTKEEAEQAVMQCNIAYQPFIQDSITERWAIVCEYAEGWGFELPSSEIWSPSGNYSQHESPNFLVNLEF